MSTRSDLRLDANNIEGVYADMWDFCSNRVIKLCDVMNCAKENLNPVYIENMKNNLHV